MSFLPHLETHLHTKLLELLFGQINVPVLSSDMGLARPVAILAAHTMKVLGLLQIEIPGFVGKIPLWIPPHDMAAEAFRIVMPRHLGSFAGMDEGLGRMMMPRLFPYGIGLSVAIATRFRADEFPFRIRHRSQPQALQAQLLQLLLVGAEDVEHFAGILEAATRARFADNGSAAEDRRTHPTTPTCIPFVPT